MGQVSSFSGGDKLTKYLENLAKQTAKGGELRVGFLEGATYPDGTSVAMVAAIQEFGAPAASIPARPFMKPTVERHSSEWGEILGDELVANEYDGEKALKLVGQLIEGEIAEQISETMGPPLSPITLMLRKMRSEDQSLVVTGKTVGEAAARVKAGESTDGVSTKPLVDSGHLIDSIGSEVRPQ